MLDLPLACTVRGCGQRLLRRGRALVCERGHSYDIARSGYVNLLQPQDRRALDAGDSKDLVAARSRLLDAGFGRAVVDAFADIVGTRELPEAAVTVDLGSGSGHALAAVARRTGCGGIGVDLSVRAADHAARANPALTWVVANADRRLPFMDATISVVLSMHGRRNPEECARVLRPGGVLLVAVPGADDLIELRAAVQGIGVERDRVGALIAQHKGLFAPLQRQSVKERHLLDAAALRDLLKMTYRGARPAEASAASALDAMEVTFASEVVAFAKS